MTTDIILSNSNSNSRGRSEVWAVVSALLLGQSVSFVLALINFTSSLSANLGANSPVTLGLFGYFSLTIVNGSILLYQRRKLIIPWYWYALLAFFDVQGNYLCRFASLNILLLTVFMQLNLVQQTRYVT